MPSVEEFKQRNYYQRLGLPRTSTVAEIKEAYREIARVYHPDSHFFEDLVEYEITEDDVAIFQMVTAAYDTLIREEKRKVYDRSLPPESADESGKCEAPKPTTVKGTKEWDAPKEKDPGTEKKAEFKTKVRAAESTKSSRERKTTGKQDMQAAREQFAKERGKPPAFKRGVSDEEIFRNHLIKGVVATIWIGIGCLLLYIL